MSTTSAAEQAISETSIDCTGDMATFVLPSIRTSTPPTAPPRKTNPDCSHSNATFTSGIRSLHWSRLAGAEVLLQLVHGLTCMLNMPAGFRTLWWPFQKGTQVGERFFVPPCAHEQEREPVMRTWHCRVFVQHAAIRLHGFIGHTDAGVRNRHLLQHGRVI